MAGGRVTRSQARKPADGAAAPAPAKEEPVKAKKTPAKKKEAAPKKAPAPKKEAAPKKAPAPKANKKDSKKDAPAADDKADELATLEDKVLEKKKVEIEACKQ